MKKNNYSRRTIKGLLQAHSAIMAELKSREVLRSRNNPVADFSEWLIAKSLKLKLEGNSTTGYDAVDKKKVRYQIKGRRIVDENKSTQLSAIRNLSKKQFDFLIGIIFDSNYKTLYVAKIPHSVIKEYARFSKHVNAHLLTLRENIFEDKRIKDITKSILSKY